MGLRYMSRHQKRLRKAIILCSFTAMFLVASTYAWFVGMKTVNVSSFDINIATTEGLYLSMNGENWSYSLDAKSSTPYTNNTNSWAEDGLIPVSTVGAMDSTTSRMVMYEKGSLTTTKGGYRLLSSRVHNYDQMKDGKLQEAKGYVAFDLFIKNLSGAAYYADNNVNNEEAIYLTTNSEVKAVADGTDKTGIANSVRVAFTEIGRVAATTGNDTGAADYVDQISAITGITCSNSGTTYPVTGICRNARIWEPNDTSHVQNAINWYNTSCLKRTGGTVNDPLSYSSDACGTVVDGTANKTYAISNPLVVGSNVDVYDGAQYNTYGTSVSTYEAYLANPTSTKLVDFPYFTDTMKMDAGNTRTSFITLAPNSITKVRVYVYIEGQDIDNYDFASLGKQVSINFGFTKERYTVNGTATPDFNYDGPSTLITPTATPTE